MQIPAKRTDHFVVGISVKAYNWQMRQLRKDKGWTQKDLAEMADVSIETVQSLETFRNEQSRIPWEVADRIASCLESTTDELFPSWFKARAVREAINGDTPVRLTEDMADSDDLTRGAIQEQLYARLGTALESLTDIERKVLDLRYGLSDGKCRLLSEIAEQPLGIYSSTVTRERIRQIEEKALRKLRHPFRATALREILEA